MSKHYSLKLFRNRHDYEMWYLPTSNLIAVLWCYNDGGFINTSGNGFNYGA